jgi:hypothetical protein
MDDCQLGVLVMFSQSFIIVSVIQLFGCKLVLFAVCVCGSGQNFVIIRLIISVDR